MLKTREAALGVGLASAALAWMVYSNALPSVAEARVSAAGDRDLAATERTASWTAAAIVTGVALLAQDMTVFVIGGTSVVMLAWWHRHANLFDPDLGSAMLPSSRQVMNEVDTSASYLPAS